MTRIIIALLAGAAGIALTLAGVAVDAWLHAQDGTLAAREGVFTLSNPGHAMLAAGMALACAGILAALHIAWGMSNAQGILGRRWVRLIATPAAGAASAAAVLFALATSASGHQHTDADASHAHDAISHTAPASVTDASGGSIDALVIARPTAHSHVEPTAEMPVDGAATAGAMAPATAAPHAHVGAMDGASGDVSSAAPSTVADAHMHADEMPAAPAADAMPTSNAAEHHPKPSADELACLADLTAQAKAATVRFEDFAVALAEGYVSNALDPGKTHHPNRAYKRDGVIFDLARPESLIYVTQDDGTKRLVGALYHAPVGAGPTPCGAATFWHTHGQCIDATGAAVPEKKDKSCPAGMEHRDGNVEMMHLWFVPRGNRSSS